MHCSKNTLYREKDKPLIWIGAFIAQVVLCGRSGLVNDESVALDNWYEHRTARVRLLLC